MAVTITPYNHTLKKLANKEFTYSTLKVMLLNAAAVSGFNAADTALATVVARGAQVSGNGWTTGGETIASVAITTVTTNDAMLDGNDISKTASGGSIGPAYGAVCYDDTDASDAPLFMIDFGQAEEAGDTTDFKIIWPAAGIISFTTT